MPDLILILSLTALGYFAGTWAENRHYRSIREREKQLLHIPAITMKDIPYPNGEIRSSHLVEGSAVISIDYFKRLLAGLRNIFGGTIISYESLLDRARREALLRMKESAPDAAVIVNVRIETSAIGKYSSKRNIGCIEALAYGTAIDLKKQ